MFMVFSKFDILNPFFFFFFFFFFTALVGTLKAAKKKKIVTYAGELLLQGVHDDVDIILLVDEE